MNFELKIKRNIKNEGTQKERKMDVGRKERRWKEMKRSWRYLRFFIILS